MPPRFRRLHALPLLCCLLTGIASGDDFSVLRLIFGPARAVSAPLPLDDPNTDFVDSADGSAAGSAGKGDVDVAPPPCRVAAMLGPLTYGSPSPPHPPGATYHPPIQQSDVPLRC
jgi:hypothetical protein